MFFSSELQTSGEFNWDSNLQGLVLGAFFYGYILTQVPGGFLAERLGGKWLYGCGVLMTAVLTILTPLAARCSVYLFIAVRVLEGIGEVSQQKLYSFVSEYSEVPKISCDLAHMVKSHVMSCRHIGF